MYKFRYSSFLVPLLLNTPGLEWPRIQIQSLCTSISSLPLLLSCRLLGFFSSGLSSRREAAGGDGERESLRAARPLMERDEAAPAAGPPAGAGGRRGERLRLRERERERDEVEDERARRRRAGERERERERDTDDVARRRRGAGLERAPREEDLDLDREEDRDRDLDLETLRE